MEICKAGRILGKLLLKKENPMRLHKEFPVTPQKLTQIISDIRRLYPETDSISIVGTYARLSEKPPDKKHDVDILIHFPQPTNRRLIEDRDDSSLWYKWSGYKADPVIDFLFMFGKTEPRYGQHVWRMENKLKTPKVLVWKR
jgi:predicted nucleotidyltransferase